MKARRSRVKSAVERDRVAREELLELSWVGRDLHAAPPVQLFPDVLKRIVIVLGGKNSGVGHPRKNTRDTGCGVLSGTADAVGQRIEAGKHPGEIGSHSIYGTNVAATLVSTGRRSGATLAGRRNALCPRRRAFWKIFTRRRLGERRVPVEAAILKNFQTQTPRRTPCVRRGGQPCRFIHTGGQDGGARAQREAHAALRRGRGRYRRFRREPRWNRPPSIRSAPPG